MRKKEQFLGCMKIPLGFGISWTRKSEVHEDFLGSEHFKVLLNFESHQEPKTRPDFSLWVLDKKTLLANKKAKPIGLVNSSPTQLPLIQKQQFIL